MAPKTDPPKASDAKLASNDDMKIWEERQAGNAIAALKAKLAINARVKRGGKWVTPPARELVPGDAIRLRLCDIVPADARLLAGDPIEVDESALTGESLPATHKSGARFFPARSFWRLRWWRSSLPSRFIAAMRSSPHCNSRWC